MAIGHLYQWTGRICFVFRHRPSRRRSRREKRGGEAPWTNEIIEIWTSLGSRHSGCLTPCENMVAHDRSNPLSVAHRYLSDQILRPRRAEADARAIERRTRA